MTGHRNLTVNLPEELLQQVRVLAAGKNQSLTTIVKRALERELQNDNSVGEAARQMVARMRNSPDCGLHGRIPWTRDDIYDRAELLPSSSTPTFLSTPMIPVQACDSRLHLA